MELGQKMDGKSGWKRMRVGKWVGGRENTWMRGGDAEWDRGKVDEKKKTGEGTNIRGESKGGKQMKNSVKKKKLKWDGWRDKRKID